MKLLQSALAVLTVIVVSATNASAQETCAEAVQHVGSAWNACTVAADDHDKMDAWIEELLDVLDNPEGAGADYHTAYWRSRLGGVAWDTGSYPLQERAYKAAVDYWDTLDLVKLELQWVTQAIEARTQYARVLSETNRLVQAKNLHEGIVELWDKRKAILEATLARGELAVTLNRMGEKQRAVDMGREVLALLEKDFPEEEALPQLMRNLAAALDDTGATWDNEVLELLQGAVSTYEGWLKGKDEDLKARAAWHLPVAQWELADILRTRGQFVPALRLAQQSMQALVVAYGPTDFRTVPPRGIMAGILGNIGDAETACRLLDENLLIFEAKYPPSDNEVKRVRTNLSGMLLYAGNVERATKLLESAVSDYKENTHFVDRRLATTYRYLAVCYLQSERYEKALEILELSKKLAEDNPFVTMSNTGTRVSILRRMGKYSEAVELSESVLPTMLKHGAFNQASPVIRDYALACVRLDSEPRLIGALEQILNYSEARLKECSVLPGQRGYHLAKILGENMDLVWSLAPAQPSEKATELRRRAFELMESLRGISLRSAHLRAQALKNPKAAKHLLAAQTAREQLSRLGTGGEGSDKKIFTLALERDSQTFDALFDALGGSPLEIANVSIAKLAQQLPKGAVAVTFRRLELVKVAAEGGEVTAVDHLFVFVIDKEGDLRFADLGLADEIAQLAHAWREAIRGGWRGVGTSTRKNDPTAPLIKRIVDPLKKLTGSAEVLCVCLADALHEIPVELLDKDLEFRFLNSLLDLGRKTAEDAAKPRLFGIGGIDYGPVDDKLHSLGDSNLPTFEELRYTARELDSVVKLFPGKESATLRGNKATLAEVRDGIEQAEFVHVATHGYFLEHLRPMDGATDEAWNSTLEEFAPMVLCGLALSGANSSYQVVTAEEIAALDLSHCQLVVLSACQSYLGKERAGQGLASLQAALHAAGARTVLTARWKVDDEATAQFMREFYTSLWKSESSALGALKTAKTRTKANSEFKNAKYWAAWILTGAQ